MTTSNTFRGKKLVTNQPPPLVKRPHQYHKSNAHIPVQTVIVNVSMAASFGGWTTTVNRSGINAVDQTGGSWLASFTDDQGQPCTVEIHTLGINAPLNFQYNLFFGGSWIPVANAHDTAYNGSLNWDTGNQLWTSFSGAVRAILNFS